MSIRPKKQYDQLPITPIEIDIGKKKSEDETLFHQLEIEQPNNDGNNLDSNLFESMVNTSGMTIFQVEALLFTGLIYLLEGFQVSLSGLIFLPIVSHYQLSQLYGCIISSSLVFFMGIGSLFTGYLTLLWQRRFILIMGLTIIFLGNMFAVIQNYYILLLSRSVIGFSLGVILPITMNNLVEILPSKWRSFWMIADTFFFSIGAILSCSFLYMLYPSINYFFLALSIPSFLVCAVYVSFYKENPRYLILNGEHEKGFETIEKYMNGGKPLNEGERVQIIKGVDFGMNKEVKLWGKFYFMFKRYFKITLILTSIWILYSIMINGGVFSLFLGLSHSSSFIIEDEADAKFKDTFNIFVIFYAVFGVSVVLSGLITEIRCIGRKFTIFIGFIISTLVSFLIIVEGFGNGIFFGLGAFFVNLSFNAINSYSIEIYPTRVRDFATGYLQFISRISGFCSNLAALYIFNYYSNWMFYLNMFIGITGIICTFMLPFDTYEKDLDSSIAEIRNIKERPVEEIII